VTNRLLMKNKIILIPTLTVEVVTGDTCYPGEGGFSSICAKIEPVDANLAGQLSHVQERGDVITVRCAMLDATGRITNCISDGGKQVFVMVIDNLTYRRPSG
jgi:hypothetical protein